MEVLFFLNFAIGNIDKTEIIDGIRNIEQWGENAPTGLWCLSSGP